LQLFHSALIIDDEPDLCGLLKVILSEFISEIKYAHSLESAEMFLAQSKPDIIFLDNNLPDGQGVNYIHALKKISPQSQLIIITASEVSKEKILALGGDELLEKPLSDANIRRALATI